MTTTIKINEVIVEKFHSPFYQPNINEIMEGLKAEQDYVVDYYEDSSTSTLTTALAKYKGEDCQYVNDGDESSFSTDVEQVLCFDVYETDDKIAIRPNLIRGLASYTLLSQARVNSRDIITTGPKGW